MKFQGSEPLDKVLAGYYVNDHINRLADIQLARWNGVDALAEGSHYQSPYTYLGNDPVNLRDADGLAETPANEGFDDGGLGAMWNRMIMRDLPAGAGAESGYHNLVGISLGTRMLMAAGLLDNSYLNYRATTAEGRQELAAMGYRVRTTYTIRVSGSKTVLADGSEFINWERTTISDFNKEVIGCGCPNPPCGNNWEYDVPFWGTTKRADEAFWRGDILEGLAWTGVAFGDLFLVRQAAKIGVNGAKSLGNVIGNSLDKFYSKRAINSLARAEGIVATQQGTSSAKVSQYAAQMRNGTFDYAATGSRIGAMQHDGKLFITEGHHRMKAAMQIAVQDGTMVPLNNLLLNGRIEILNPKNYGLFPFKW